MMTIKSITSNQVVRIAELAAVAARNATYSALEQVPLDSETAQYSIITKGGEFQALLSEGFASLVTRALNKMSGRKHPQAEMIEKYFAEVLGCTLDLSGVVFPEKEGFATYMAVPMDLDEDDIIKRLTSHFNVNPCSWLSPIASNINREVEQKRPQGLYVFAHRGGDEPDVEHLKKSYDDGVAEGMTFVNPKEYLLVTGFHRFANKSHFMDVKGRTRTSSLWLDGGLVRGNFDPRNSGLCLGGGGRTPRRPVDGPRELVLAT